MVFNKMASTVIGVFIVLSFQVLSFTESNCGDFIADDERPPTHPT